MRRSILFSIALVFLYPSLAPARTWQVPVDAPTIQAGIDSSTAGDTVMVACDTYFEHDIAMKSGVCLRSETGQADCVIIDAQQQGRVMACQSANEETRIEGITFVGGFVEGSGNSGTGGGLLCMSANVDFRTF